MQFPTCHLTTHGEMWYFINKQHNPQPQTTDRQVGICRAVPKITCHCETSAHTGRGNPPVSGEMFRKVPVKLGAAALFGGNRYLVPWDRGIATPVCALARNDIKYSANNNLSCPAASASFHHYTIPRTNRKAGSFLFTPAAENLPFIHNLPYPSVSSRDLQAYW